MKLNVVILGIITCIVPWEVVASNTPCIPGSFSWRSARFPSVAINEYPTSDDILNAITLAGRPVPSNFYTVLSAELGHDGWHDLFIRDDWDVGNHVTRGRIYELEAKGYRKLFQDDVNRTEQPIIILAGITNGYYDLCVKIICCGVTTITIYRFDGTHYKASESSTE